MSSAKIEVIDKYCKGCAICAEFCPKDVLEMETFVVKVVKPEACIKCMQCELRCPDFAIKVHDA
ncbi:MAG: tungsten formylmethanofuran dehydrogenase [Desulfuromonas sp.]|nr:MAG: tungsten formylmethanofuran dehydrogenase [Desulfuromonas sp.]